MAYIMCLSDIHQHTSFCKLRTLTQLTTGNREFAVCLKVCRVLFIGHTAKSQFAVRIN